MGNNKWAENEEAKREIRREIKREIKARTEATKARRAKYEARARAEEAKARMDGTASPRSKREARAQKQDAFMQRYYAANRGAPPAVFPWPSDDMENEPPEHKAAMETYLSWLDALD